MTIHDFVVVKNSKHHAQNLKTYIRIIDNCFQLLEQDKFSNEYAPIRELKIYLAKQKEGLEYHRDIFDKVLQLKGVNHGSDEPNQTTTSSETQLGTDSEAGQQGV